MLKVYNTVFLDAGHGGLDDKGNYTTPAVNGKRFTHHSTDFSKRVRSKYFPNEFLEGVKNRTYADLIAKKLTSLGVNVIKVYNESLDTPLNTRTSIANQYHSTVNKGIYLSEHSNAANTKARGVSVWTSIGQTKSDYWADLVYNELSLLGISLMKQMNDGDVDYESNFHVLVQTNMPSILMENLFFDNIEDAKILDTEEYLDIYTTAVVNATIKFLDLLNSEQ